MSLEAICKSVPPELQEIMANKPSARAAWEDLKTANLGVERVRRAKADTLRREFDSLVFKDGESIDEFSVRINGVVQQRRTLGDEVDEVTVVRKFLQARPPRYHHITMSIETLLDVEDVPVEELVGRLKAAEERHALTGGGTGLAQLNLTEDELVARLSKRLNIGADKGQASGVVEAAASLDAVEARRREAREAVAATARAAATAMARAAATSTTAHAVGTATSAATSAATVG